MAPGISRATIADDLLRRIANAVQEQGENLPEHRELPAKVGGMAQFLDAIEELLRPPDARRKLKRSTLPAEVEKLLANCHAHNRVILDVSKEVFRLTSRQLPFDQLSREVKVMIDSFEDIERIVRPQHVKKIPFRGILPQLEYFVTNIEADLRESLERNEVLKCDAEQSKAVAAEQQTRINRLEQREGDLMDSHNRSLNKLQVEKNLTISKLQKEVVKITKQGSQDRNTMQDLQREIKQVKDDRKMLQDGHIQTISGLKHSHEEQIREMVDQFAEQLAQALEAQARELTVRHEADSKSQQNIFHQRMTRLETQYQRKIVAQDQAHKSAIDASEAAKREELAAQKDDYESQLEEKRQRTVQIEQTWKLKMADLEQDFQTAKAKWEQESNETKKRNTEKLKEMENVHRNALEAAQKRFDKLLEEQRQERSRLENFLFKKDKEGLADQEILRGVPAAKEGQVVIIGFIQITSKVATFSEWEWREDRKVWPDEEMTSLVGKKQRRLKKLILGDAIWTTLFQLVFDSPFRILGEEGKKQEKDWTKNYRPGDDDIKEGYKWPTPTASSEKFRSDTCQAALDALTKPSSPYGTLRFSFIKNQEPFHKQFFGLIESFVEVTEKREQDLLRFLTEIVRMWLVFCAQPYRLRLILPGSVESDPVKKMRLLQEQKDLGFTVAPRLQRYGNPRGAQLEEISVVSGCIGEVGTVTETL